MSTFIIMVAKDFSDTPGGRYIKDGDFSGEQFLRKHLEPALKKLNNGDKILVDLDGGYGYGISFLEEAFGGLARKFTSEKVNECLDFKSDDEPELIPLIREYIKNANN